MERLYYLNHAPIDFHFAQTPRDFVVEEIPLYPFSGAGEHLVLKIRKRNLSTFELVDILSSHLGIKSREIGYAGLKDKSALTLQHLSIPAKFGDKLEAFDHPEVKILEQVRHENKIRIGHLKGNRFFIRLKKLSPLNSLKIQGVLEEIKRWGIPNYFGYQRFGNDGNNHEIGRKIAHGEQRVTSPKRRTFLLSAYQSKLFNEWLKERIKLSKILAEFTPSEASHLTPMIPVEQLKALQKQPHPFKILPGEILHHYPHGKIFVAEDMEEESRRFVEKDIVPAGLLSGTKAKSSEGIAHLYEAPFIDEKIQEQGSRRLAWIFPEDLEYRYIEEEAHGELNFYLPKGSYATVLIEELAHREIKID